jgi:hypothetical protein
VCPRLHRLGELRKHVLLGTQRQLDLVSEEAQPYLPKLLEATGAI